MWKLRLPIVLFLFSTFLPRYKTNDAMEFFEKLKIEKVETFDALREQFQLFVNDRMPTRVERDIYAVNGDTWYSNYQQKECEASNKSFCIGVMAKSGQHDNIGGVSEVKHHAMESKNNEEDDERINEKTMHQMPSIVSRVQESRDDENSNYNANIQARLKAKTIWAQKQDEVHQIESMRQHALTATAPETKLQNENQFHLSNSNFPNSYHDLDSSSSEALLDEQQHEEKRRSSGQKQKLRHYDDQLDTRKNDLYDEVGEKLSKKEQQGLLDDVGHRRVKRRDVIAQMTHAFNNELTYDVDYESLMRDVLNNENAMDNSLNDKQHVNTSSSPSTASTVATKEEMNNGNKKFSNDKSEYRNQTRRNAVNNQAAMKMQTSPSNIEKVVDKRDTDNYNHNEHENSYVIKGKQKISDLISGELPNEIIKHVHKVINSNKMLKQHIKPHLPEPKYTTLKDSTKLNSIKISNMMTDLVTYINELVDDQIEMRTCIPLTPELHDFYVQLMGRDVDEEAAGNVIEDDESASRYEKSIQRFLMPKRKLRGKIVRKRRNSQLDLDEKCSKVKWFQLELPSLTISNKLKRSLSNYFASHQKICDILKDYFKNDLQLSKHKRSLEGANVTPQFAKLYAFKNYFIESKFNDI